MKYKGIVLSYFILKYCFGCVFVYEYDNLFCKATINISENEYVDIQFNSNNSFAVITEVDYYINRNVESELFLYIPKALNIDDKQLAYVNRIGCNGTSHDCTRLKFSIYIDEKFILVEKVVLNIFYGVNAYDHYNTPVCSNIYECKTSYDLKNPDGTLNGVGDQEMTELIVNERFY